MKSFILTLTILTSLFVYGQLEKQHWHFGSTSKGLFFDANNSYAVTVTNHSYIPYGNEGCAVVTDPTNGDLMFYTDGVIVIDSTHNPMPNGTGLNGLSSSFNSAKVCLNPANCRQYYIVSNDFAGGEVTSGNLYYSLLDMDLAGNGTVADPLGDVTNTKNVLLSSDVSEAVTIIPRKNSSDSWLLVAKNTTDQIEIYLISSTGISYSNSFSLSQDFDDLRSMNYSDESGKICLLSNIEAMPSILLDFNNSTGLISNEMTIPGTPWGAATNNWEGTWDGEWSPDGTKLYLSKYRWGSSSGGRLYQYDLDNPTVSPIMIHSLSSSNAVTGKGLRLAPNGKIYMLYKDDAGDTRYLNSITYPDSAGLACGFVVDDIDMGIDMGNTQVLPTFLSYNRELLAEGGCFEASGFNEVVLTNSFSINSVQGKTGFFILNFEDFVDSEIEMSIIDMKGSIVHRFLVSNQQTILDLQFLSEGIYVIDYSSESRVSAIKFKR